MLFAPGSRPDLVAKMPRSAPDLAVIDLEDGVIEAARATARTALPGLVAGLVAGLAGDVGAVGVRVSAHVGPAGALDLAAAAVPGLSALVVPKAESPAALAGFADRLDAHGMPDSCGVVVGIESARGVAAVFDLLACSDRIVGAYFGAEDFVSSMGGRRTKHGAEVAHARARVVLAARAGGCFALDQALPDFRDEHAFRADAEAGRDLGYDGKLCIHPAQVTIANHTFTPSPLEVERARSIVHEFDAAVAHGDATPVIDGTLVDEAVVRRLRAVASPIAPEVAR
jgi:citrate lyase subunit beta/citryl-CoA lyase